MSEEDQLILLKLKFARFYEDDYDYDVAYKYESFGCDIETKRVITMRTMYDVQKSEVYI
jgi:hypothetical protein